MLVLSKVRPDFESLLLQLQLAISQKESWTEMQTSGTGETILELIAAVGTMLQFGIESSARENFISTAARASSLYAIANMLGVKVHRKYPAGVAVQLRRTNTATSEAVPKLTQFQVNSANFFNRNPLMFAAGSATASERVYYGEIEVTENGTAINIDRARIGLERIENGQSFQLLINSGGGAGTLRTVTFDEQYGLFRTTAIAGTNNLTVASLLNTRISLYEGTVKAETFTSDAVEFKEIVLGVPSFRVSDVDIDVQVFNPSTREITTWDRLEDPIWTAGINDRVFYDSTDGDGNAVITFGDGLHGAIPQLSTKITITYAETRGAAGNNGSQTLEVTCDELGITGSTTSVISGGADEKPASYYRAMAPHIFKARNRSVTGDDYKAIALDFPGVISASVLGQRDIAPADLRWMNVVQICLLPLDASADALTLTDWNNFLAYMEQRKHAAVHILTKDPVKRNATVEITLALKRSYTPSAVIPAAEAAVRNLFARQSDTLGRRIAVSDILDTAKVEGVDYVDAAWCTTSSVQEVVDLVPVDTTQFISLSRLTINTKFSERSVYFGS